LISWFIWLLSIFLEFLIGSAYIMPYVRKLKTKMSTLRYLLQKLKNKAGHSKKKGITIVGLLIMMLSKSLGFQKIKLLYHSSLYPPTTYHVSIFLVRVIFSYAGFHNFHKKLLWDKYLTHFYHLSPTGIVAKLSAR